MYDNGPKITISIVNGGETGWIAGMWNPETGDSWNARAGLDDDLARDNALIKAAFEFFQGILGQDYRIGAFRKVNDSELDADFPQGYAAFEVDTY